MVALTDSLEVLMAAVDAIAGAARSTLTGLDGQLIVPGDTGFDAARRVNNGMIDRNPAAIVRCASAGDVARAIAFARSYDLPLAVRGGGHSTAGFGTCDAGVVADLGPLRSIAVDTSTATVRVGGGCTWGEVDAATHAVGMATPAGVFAPTGVGGLTLGGGHGYLTRRYGLTIDNLLEAEVVVADGSHVRASEDAHADLFWALRGGGGNFGVVTGFRFRMHPVSIVQGGFTFWPLELLPELLTTYRDFLPALPRDAYAYVATATVPAAPSFPAELHGRRVCAVLWCHLGDAAAAAADFAPMLAVGPALLHVLDTMPLPALHTMFEPLYPPGLQVYWQGAFLAEMGDELIDLQRLWNERLPTALSTTHIYPVDGAAHDVAPDATAFAHRDATWSQIIAAYDPDPANAGRLRDWAVGYAEAIAPFTTGAGYVNFLMDEGPDRVVATYGANHARLRAVKRVYDPENVFHLNQNIEPAREPGGDRAGNSGS